MLKKLQIIIKQNFEVFTLILLIFVTAISTSYYNFNKKYKQQTYENFIDIISSLKVLLESSLTKNIFSLFDI